MDIFKVISDLTTLPGVTGNEVAVAEVLKGYFRAYTDDVWLDVAGNCYARIGNKEGPTLLVMAHMDEVGLMVSDIEDNGMLRLHSVAGVDPRVLPGSEVTVHGKKRIPAVIGAMPPHLLSAEDQKKNYKLDDLVCDTALPAEEVKANVSVGDNVTFALYPPMELKNGFIAGKTFDDRACVAAMLYTMELLKNVKLNCNLIFCGSTQEEGPNFGATCGSWNTAPDMAIAIDVCHAPQPGAKSTDYVEFDQVSLTVGSNVNQKMYEWMCDVGTEMNINWVADPCMGHSGTDAHRMQVACAGVATGIISLPLRYMHTSVEVIHMDTLKNCAKLLAGFAASIGEDWEEKLCLDD